MLVGGLLGLLWLLHVTGGAPAPLAAFGGGGVVPLVGAWCGMTDDGGSVQLTVSEDGRFVRRIEIRTPAGSIVQSEGFDRAEAQIKSGSFLWRGVRGTEAANPQPGPPSAPQPVRPGNPGRCTRAPCRPVAGPPPPPGSSRGAETTNMSVTVRGTFETPDSVDGSYTGLTTVSGGSSRPGTTRLQGRYTAWPASFAACP